MTIPGILLFSGSFHLGLQRPFVKPPSAAYNGSISQVPPPKGPSPTITAGGG
ncbi:uncharacterized protein DNG_02985 [Cephalotrichum gorgonifer]|uniref:Uncharacterized protein n=1 Tax=Cephalotrichum gorgonifer TaxID=2041049 RepID=A0AAE8ST48_9PEZI|nr:uncharacterized protein DNG_02985 [Cephalotrichum gorgonifer]